MRQSINDGSRPYLAMQGKLQQQATKIGNCKTYFIRKRLQMLLQKAADSAIFLSREETLKMKILCDFQVILNIQIF